MSTRHASSPHRCSIVEHWDTPHPSRRTGQRLGTPHCFGTHHFAFYRRRRRRMIRCATSEHSPLESTGRSSRTVHRPGTAHRCRGPLQRKYHGRRRRRWCDCPHRHMTCRQDLACSGCILPLCRFRGRNTGCQRCKRRLCKDQIRHRRQIHTCRRRCLGPRRHTVCHLAQAAVSTRHGGKIGYHIVLMRRMMRTGTGQCRSSARPSTGRPGYGCCHHRTACRRPCRKQWCSAPRHSGSAPCKGC